ncbi:hypothetical protein [Comamonas kerstersii]|uniref:hypothetical protein n=1 Tax=Comamonas kerstersii TaxID=225992 RepID=UPI0010624BB4|nr:hypothetical protein [Comamonas kerstersii]
MEKFGFSEGVALGMISADANSARSRANRLSYALDDVQARNRELEQENAQLRAKLAQYEKAYGDTHKKAVSNARMASAGLAVMRSMINCINSLPSQLAENFKKEILELSSNRIKELDAKYIAEARGLGIKPITVKGVFSSVPEYEKLGFDRVL